MTDSKSEANGEIHKANNSNRWSKTIVQAIFLATSAGFLAFVSFLASFLLSPFRPIPALQLAAVAILALSMIGIILLIVMRHKRALFRLNDTDE